MQEPEIVYEDENLIAVNKPAGLLTHAAGKGEEGTLTHWMVSHYSELEKIGDPERPGLVHRLDKETSGLILFAKNEQSFIYLKSLFKERKILKIYQAFVWGKVEPAIGKIEKAIGIKSGTVKHSVFSEKMAKPAVTEYKVLNFLEKDKEIFSLLEIKPWTGRTHQIRIHLASIGHPVVGDELYSKRKTPFAYPHLFLHAWKLELLTPDGKKLRLEADLPDEFALELQTLSYPQQ